MNPLRLVVALLSLALYAVSLALPVLYLGPDSVQGLLVLLWGWIGLEERDSVAWLANPVFVLALALLAFKRDRGAAWLALLAAGLGLDTFRVVRFGSVPGLLDSVGPGYYLWTLSFLVLAAGGFWRAMRERRQAPPA